MTNVITMKVGMRVVILLTEFRDGHVNASLEAAVTHGNIEAVDDPLLSLIEFFSLQFFCRICCLGSIFSFLLFSFLHPHLCPRGSFAFHLIFPTIEYQFSSIIHNVCCSACCSLCAPGSSRCHGPSSSQCCCFCQFHCDQFVNCLILTLNLVPH